jgi:hypothetical protein
MQSSRFRPLAGKSQVIAGRVLEILIDAQIPFGRGQRGVPVGELDLLDLRPALVRELAVGAPQIVRLQFERELLRVLAHDAVDRGRRHALPHEPPALVDFAQQQAG